MGKKKLCPYYNSWNDLYQEVIKKFPKATTIHFKWFQGNNYEDVYDYSITMRTLKIRCWEEYQEKLNKSKCECLKPIPNYPEMVWCNICGKEL